MPDVREKSTTYKDNGKVTMRFRKDLVRTLDAIKHCLNLNIDLAQELE